MTVAFRGSGSARQTTSTHPDRSRGLPASSAVESPAIVHVMKAFPGMSSFRNTGLAALADLSTLFGQRFSFLAVSSTLMLYPVPNVTAVPMATYQVQGT